MDFINNLTESSNKRALAFNRDTITKLTHWTKIKPESWVISEPVMRIEKLFNGDYVNLNSIEFVHQAILIDRDNKPVVMCEFTNEGVFSASFFTVIGEHLNYELNKRAERVVCGESQDCFAFFDKQIEHYHFYAESYFCSLVLFYYVSVKSKDMKFFETLVDDIKKNTVISPLMNYSHSYFFSEIFNQNVLSPKMTHDEFIWATGHHLDVLGKRFELNLITNYRHFHEIMGGCPMH